ncbi:MAG: NAD(P)-binding domain-containing protein [Planctomycetota bacterium]
MHDATPSESTSTLLIGAGPIGLELAVCLKHLGANYLHLDAGNVGQTVINYPKQTRYFSSPERIAIAGVALSTVNGEKATREHYLAYLQGVVKQFDLPIRRYTKVTGLKRHDDGTFEATTPHRTIHAKHVVLAIGDMHHPRWLQVPGEDLPHVSHHFDEPYPYVGQRLLIVGGRNSAVEAALRCHHAGAKVTLSYRQDHFDERAIKYWLLPEIQALIKHGQIDFHPGTVPTRIEADGVTLRTCDGAKDKTKHRADFVLLLTGYEQDKTLFASAGVTLEGQNQSPRVDPDTMMTNVPNLFVAGTAAAGTQVSFSLFIENCHEHARKIATAITGSAPPDRLINNAAATFGLAES